MKHFDSLASAVDSQALSALPADASDIRQPRIEHWSVVGHDRIAGTVFNRPGASDGKTIITSPVVQVRMMGEIPAPVAFTESGTAYRLGEPAAHFGLDRAEHFVWFKSRQSHAWPTRPDPELRTGYGSLA